MYMSTRFLLLEKSIRKISNINMKLCRTSSRLLNHRALSSSLATLKEKEIVLYLFTCLFIHLFIFIRALYFVFFGHNDSYNHEKVNLGLGIK